MALTLKFKTFSLDIDNKKGSCNCYYTDISDVPEIDDYLDSYFVDEFDAVGQDGADWKITSRLFSPDRDFLRVDLNFVYSPTGVTAVSPFTPIEVLPKTYNRRAELIDSIKGVDGNGTSKVAVFNTFQGVVQDTVTNLWDRNDDWTDDPDIKTPGTKKTIIAIEWSFTTTEKKSFLTYWANLGNRIYKSQLPLSVKSSSPDIGDVAVRYAYLLKNGEEELSVIASPYSEEYKLDATFWVIINTDYEWAE